MRAQAASDTAAASRNPIAIFLKAMPGYRELLQQVKSEIDEVDAKTANELMGSVEPPLVVDVREQDEWEEGHLPRAIHVPRGNLESRIERLSPDRERPIVLYCAVGNRSAFAAKTLQELGYERVSSLAGGYTDWKRNGFPTEVSMALAPEQRRRYSRHLLIPEVDEAGQLKLLDSRVLLIGAGGLGSPASLYLAAAGVGTLGIVDEDVVDESNLQRQILHSTERLGQPKVDSARQTIEALNPDVRVKTYEERLSSANIDRILDEGWDVILQGADNFPTRYLVNDASVFHRIPVVDGSIYRFEGHVTVFRPFEGVARGTRHQDSGAVTPSPSELTGRHTNAALDDSECGPCYRCLFPEPPPPELAPSCAEGGVLGVLPGIIGALQASETLKLLLGIGEPLVGRLLQFDALAGEFLELRVGRNPECPVCGEHPSIHEYIDYVQFCQAPLAWEVAP
jgi:molybdopterin/thiamine biosynthesis adenylyltransferase/rhodanese-related sulfurtransferase